MNTAKPPKLLPFLIVIGYWEGDSKECAELVNLMVDLQKEHAGDECEVWLMRRQDCKLDKPMLEKLKTKFNAEALLGSSPLRGYPAGSNGVFSSAALKVCNVGKKYCGWLWLEPDCVPMHPGWWKELRDEWISRPAGIEVMGWKGDCNGDGSGWHITGCAIYAQQIARIVPCVTSCDGIPWDYKCRNQLLAVGKETFKIHLCWRARDAKRDIFFKHYALVHGYKDSSLMKLVREKYVRT